MARKTANKSTEMVRYQDRLAAMAKRVETAEKITGGGYPKVEIKGGNFLIDERPVEDNELEVVVIAAIHANTYYEDEWESGVYSLPVCYAFGDPNSDDPEAEMAPHPEAEEPQHESCNGCPMNEFGSAPRGKGKACKNTRRLAVMLAEDLDDVDTAEVRMLSVSPTNLRGWSSYANLLAKEYELPPLGVVTRIRVVPDPKTQHKLLFSPVSPIEYDDNLFEAMMRRVEEAEQTLTAPYRKREETPPPPPPRRRAPTKKAAPVKKVAKTAVRRTTGRKF